MPAEWLRECHRILKPGGALRLRVPVFGSPWHLIDPTHVRGFHPLNFDYFIHDSVAGSATDQRTPAAPGRADR
jgi:hypothetical protein